MTNSRTRLSKLLIAIIALVIIIFILWCLICSKCTQEKIMEIIDSNVNSLYQTAYLIKGNGNNSSISVHSAPTSSTFPAFDAANSFFVSKTSGIMSINSICEEDKKFILDTIAITLVVSDVPDSYIEDWIMSANIYLKELNSGFALKIDNIVQSSNHNLHSPENGAYVCDYINNNLPATNSIIIFFYNTQSYYYKCNSSNEFIMAGTQQITSRILVHEILHRYLNEIIDVTYARGDNIMYSRLPECERVSITAEQLYRIATLNRASGLNIEEVHYFHPNANPTYAQCVNTEFSRYMRTISANEAYYSPVNISAFDLEREIFRKNQSVIKSYQKVVENEYDYIKNLSPLNKKELYVNQSLIQYLNLRRRNAFIYLAKNVESDIDLKRLESKILYPEDKNSDFLKENKKEYEKIKNDLPLIAKKPI